MTLFYMYFKSFSCQAQQNKKNQHVLGRFRGNRSSVLHTEANQSQRSEDQLLSAKRAWTGISNIASLSDCGIIMVKKQFKLQSNSIIYD